MKAIQPVILCGGSGTRLWPKSTKEKPKQFCDFFGDGTLLEKTIARARRIPNAAEPILVGDAAHTELIQQAIDNSGVRCKVILEPVQSGTAMAMDLAVTYAMLFPSPEILLFMPADHAISDEDKFHESLENAQKYADQNLIVTFGIEQTWFCPGYGHIIAGTDLGGAYKIGEFVEEPDSETMARLCNKKQLCLWNSGMFMGKALCFNSQFLTICRKLSFYAYEAVKTGHFDDRGWLMPNDFYLRGHENISFDTAVMEKTDIGVVVPFDAGWADLGTWDAIHQHCQAFPWDNATFSNDHNPIALNDCSNCHVDVQNVSVVGIGLKNIAIVEQDHKLLVMSFGSSQKVRFVQDWLNNCGEDENEC